MDALTQRVIVAMLSTTFPAADLRRLKKHYDQYEPTLHELKTRYEVTTHTPCGIQASFVISLFYCVSPIPCVCLSVSLSLSQ